MKSCFHAEIEEPALLIRVNRKFREGISGEELYEITRGVWRIGPRRERAHIALAVFKGVVREVYIIHSWHPSGTTSYRTRTDVGRSGRWEFLGDLAPLEIRSKYIDKSVQSYFSPNSQNPIKYVNC